MRLVSITVVQDEADIIEQFITSAIGTCDLSLFYDCGSVDETLNIIKSYSRKYDSIILIHEKPIIFHEHIVRSHAARLADHYLRDGDWVLWLDSDEFIPISVRNFIAEEGSRSDYIRHRHYNFGFSEVDIKSDPYFEKYSSFDRGKYTIYKTYAYSEPRAVRYYEEASGYFFGRAPRWHGRICQFRLPILHYPIRSVPQLRKRYALRNSVKMYYEDENWAQHWEIDWRKILYKKSKSNVLKYNKKIIKNNIELKDGLLDSRIKSNNFVKQIAKVYVMNFLTNFIGPRNCLHISNLFLSGDARVPDERPEWLEKNIRMAYRSI